MSTIPGGDMGKAPAFQFYAADFLVGTFDMTAEEVGIYIRLLAFSWDKGPLPKDTSRLAVMCGVSEKVFSKAWEAVGQKWVERPDGWVNDRLEEQRAERDRFSQKAALVGLIRFGGHLPKGDYDVPTDDRRPQEPAPPPAVR